MNMLERDCTTLLWTTTDILDAVTSGQKLSIHDQHALRIVVERLEHALWLTRPHQEAA
jgi:hypothetical protein